MSDFIQYGSISTLHLLKDRDSEQIEMELRKTSRIRPIALVLPSLVTEMGSPALATIISVLKTIDYLREIIVTLGPATADEFAQAKIYFSPLRKEGRRVRIIWNDGDGIQSLYREIEKSGLAVGPHGKGRSAWMAFGYTIARKESHVIALHDCDIITYERNLLNRLVYPTAMPILGYEFCKGYYSRVTDRMHGRVTRLLVTPLIRSLIKILGDLPILRYYGSFRYPLAGEFSMLAGLARVNRIPADWGLEVGVLAEVFRNCSTNRVCQVELAHTYDHKHQDLSPDDPQKGLNKMAIDICQTVFRVLYSLGVCPRHGFFNALRATFIREAQDLADIYHDDAQINGLKYDRHGEATAIETFAEAIRISAEVIRDNPLGQPLIPNWNRVLDAIPDFDDRVAQVVDDDNEDFAGGS